MNGPEVAVTSLPSATTVSRIQATGLSTTSASDNHSRMSRGRGRPVLCDLLPARYHRGGTS